MKHDWSIIEGLLELRCTAAEVAGFLRISVDALYDACKRDRGMSFTELSERYGASGKISLRRAQMQYALEGNGTMLVWLGKQLLGQRDTHEVSVNVAERQPRELTRAEVERELAQLEQAEQLTLGDGDDAPGDG